MKYSLEQTLQIPIIFYLHSLASKSATSPSLSTLTTHCPSDTFSLVVAVAEKSLLTGADSDSVRTGLAGRADGTSGEGDRSSLTGKLANTSVLSMSLHPVTAQTLKLTDGTSDVSDVIFPEKYFSGNFPEIFRKISEHRKNVVLF